MLSPRLSYVERDVFLVAALFIGYFLNWVAIKSNGSLAYIKLTNMLQSQTDNPVDDFQLEMLSLVFYVSVGQEWV